MLVTVSQRTVFEGTITASRRDFLFEVYDIPMDFVGSLPMAVCIISGTLTLGTVEISHNLVPNPIYNHESLSRFRSAETWPQKVSILCELADPSFTQEQIEFLLLEGPEHWVAQEKILHQHGCGLSIIDPNFWREAKLYDTHSDGIVDVRQNVTVNGILQKVLRGPGLNGTWHWTICSGDVLCCDLIISPTPTINHMQKTFQGAYISSDITLDFLTKVMPFNELKRARIKILDIGTGEGQMFRALRDRGVHGLVHGLDTPNKTSDYVLTESYDEFIQADLRYPLPISTNTYDVILCSNVFVQSVVEMENDPPLSEDCLDEILRVLAPGGIFVFNLDRFCCSAFDRKLNHLVVSQKISVTDQSWGYHRDRLYMFPPTRLCTALTKI